jgi:non-ribosomal peptide synthetase component E (peptide arylation enzyme)
LIATPGELVPTVAQLVSHFAELGVARQKTPEKVIEVSDFPRTAAGKVKKNELRERLVDDEAD